MKILVATGQTQGQRPGDFAWVDEGEIAALPTQCDNVGGSCGCDRSFAGTVSHRATTTAMVVERDLDEDEYRGLLVKAYRASGWTLAEIGERRLVEDLIDVALAHPAGTVLEKRGPRIQPRHNSPVADA